MKLTVALIMFLSRQSLNSDISDDIVLIIWFSEKADHFNLDDLAFSIFFLQILSWVIYTIPFLNKNFWPDRKCCVSIYAILID